MTNKKYNHTLVIGDRSGSMSSIKDDMNQGLKEVFKEQAKLPGKNLVDVWTFDDSVEQVLDNAETGSVTEDVIQPRGMTALYDGIGIAVTKFGAKLAALPEKERPGKVLVVVLTDGGENSSREYNANKVKELVKGQEEKYAWKFLFLGANIDSFNVGGGLGFSANSTMNYVASKAGVRGMTQSVAAYASSFYSGEDVDELTLEDNSQKVSTK